MGFFRDLFTPYRGLPREVYVIFVSRFVNALGCFVMPLLTIILTDTIGLSEQKAGFYISVTGLLYVPAMILGGKLADKIGRKKVIVFFDATAALLYIVCGLMEPSLTMVYVLMAASASMAAAGPAHDSLMADLTTPENRTGGFGLSYLGWNLGFAVGPILGGLLYKDHLSWLFIGDALTALLALTLVIIFIKETLPTADQDITDEKRKLEQRAEGSVFKILWQRPTLLIFAAIAFVYNFVYSQWGFLVPLHTMQNFGEDGARFFGLLASFNGLVVIIFTPILTKYTGSVANIRRMVYAGILYGIGLGTLGFFNSTLAFFFLAMFGLTIGEILFTISMLPFVANHTPSSHRGRMSATVSLITGAGFTLGPVGMGLILTQASIEQAWVLIGISALGAAGLMYLLEKYDLRRNSEDEWGESVELKLEAE